MTEIENIINISEFEEICDCFTNKKLFKKNDDGSLKKDDSGRPIKINYDNLWMLL